MIDALDQTTATQWYPVARAKDLALDTHLGVTLLGKRAILWRTASGLHAFEDQCPHRGAQLSISHHNCGESLQCPYHGWRFDRDGKCIAMPAHADGAPMGDARLTPFAIAERYGLIWLNIGSAPLELPALEGCDERFRIAISGPFDVAACGPRIIENFLDMSHFDYVHDGLLGNLKAPSPAPQYALTSDDNGLHVSDMIVTQPKANALAADESNIHYTYHVSHSMMAHLTKGPDDNMIDDIIAIIVQPVEETKSIVWTVLARSYGLDKDDEEFIRFQDTIFLQDQAVLESQRPMHLPLDLKAEAHQQCDRVSIAYRRFLKAKGVRYGVA